jgi:hypothetical protein
MLVSNQSLSNAMSNPRQIATSTTSGILYTVPAGRKFVGCIFGGTIVSSYTLITSSGLSVFMRTNSIQLLNVATTPAEIVLIAGTSISGSGSEIYIVGVESDL